jgi:hypothetical protein
MEYPCGETHYLRATGALSTYFCARFFGLAFLVFAAPGRGMSFVGLTCNARRRASSVFSGMWILLPGCLSSAQFCNHPVPDYLRTPLFVE